MKLRQYLEPAHRDYFLTLIRRNGTREQHYLPYVYRSAAEAQRMADEKNAHYKHGVLVVESVDRPAGICYAETLRF